MSTPRHLGAGQDAAARSRRRGRRTRAQRLVLTTGCLVSIACFAGASLAGYGLVKWYQVDRVDLDTDEAEAGDPVNILLIGSDSREGEGEAAEAASPGKRTDTIMVMRLDPETEAVSLLSFPRDLWLPIAGTDDEARINSAYTEPGDQQVLIDTIRQNFAIEINHWIEVDFQGFRELVDSIGGVTLYFDRGLRDRESGLYVEQLGCVTLDGEMALAYARSRQAEYQVGDDWESDPQSDLSRIVRQQNLMAAALREALDEASSNPLRLNDLIDVGTDNVSIDSGLGIGDIRDLADRFEDMDTDRFQTASLPVEPRPGDEDATLVVDEAAAEPLLNVFRGLDPGEVSPSLVTVDVLNGTAADPTRERDGLAGDVTDAFERAGFETGTPGDDAEFHEHTTVRYAPGQASYAERVARHIDVGVVLEEDDAVEPGHVTVVAGADFGRVLRTPVAVEDLPAPPGTTATTEPPTTAPDEEAPPTSLPTGSTTTTPAQVGGVPEGAC